jgi:RNA polymerase sigma-70 factor, ECF subfamily
MTLDQNPLEAQIERAVRSFQAGRHRDECFRQIVEGYSGPLSRTLRCWVRESGDLEDLNQEIFVRVYRGLDGFKWTSSFKGWLFTVARNTAILWVKKQRRHWVESLDDEDSTEARSIAEPGLGPHEILETSEASTALRDAIGELPEKMQVVSRLRLQKGKSYKEIADHLGISIQTVKAHLSQAKSRLQKRLGPAYSLNIEPTRDEEP